MDNHINEKDLYEEPELEDFFIEEAVDEKDLRRKKRRTIFIRVGAIGIALVLLVNVLAVWGNVINIPALEFVKTSLRLSQKESVKTAKMAVVTLQGDGVKGTGFNIKEDGLIITNSHVVEKMNTITIYFPNGEVFLGKVMIDSPELDIAILDIKGEKLPTLELQSDLDWEVKEHIYVIGNPLSYTQIANEGNIEGTVMVDERQDPVMKISAPVYRGNSGSPVLTENNEVIGVVFATTVPKLKSGEKASGLAVPIEQVMELLVGRGDRSLVPAAD
jgi:serine protease Do